MTTYMATIRTLVSPSGDWSQVPAEQRGLALEVMGEHVRTRFELPNEAKWKAVLVSGAQACDAVNTLVNRHILPGAPTEWTSRGTPHIDACSNKICIPSGGQAHICPPGLMVKNPSNGSLSYLEFKETIGIMGKSYALAVNISVMITLVAQVIP
ncbi:MAG: hypothetical protein JNK58_11985 [Phycisphaerae bacterium]|nr:hypothetical protein [Phycisphaerae bacterium]